MQLQLPHDALQDHLHGTLMKFREKNYIKYMVYIMLKITYLC